MDFFEKLCCSRAAADSTDKTVELVKQQIEKYFDCVKTDVLGSVVFVKKIGTGKKLMLCTGIDTPGVAAVFAEKSKINIAPVGKASWQSLAYSMVDFNNASGVLTPPKEYNGETALTDYVVETYDNNAEKAVSLGEVGFVREDVKNVADNVYVGFGAGVKMCVYTLCRLSELLLTEKKQTLLDMGIGEVCVAFLGQEKLLSRGASAAAFDFSPNHVINLSTFNLDEKNVGSFGTDDGILVKMADKGFVASEDAAQMAQTILDSLKIPFKRCVSCTEVSALSKLTLGKDEQGSVEICIPVKHCGTRGETAIKLL